MSRDNVLKTVQTIVTAVVPALSAAFPAFAPLIGAAGTLLSFAIGAFHTQPAPKSNP